MFWGKDVELVKHELKNVRGDIKELTNIVQKHVDDDEKKWSENDKRWQVVKYVLFAVLGALLVANPVLLIKLIPKLIVL